MPPSGSGGSYARWNPRATPALRRTPGQACQIFLTKSLQNATSRTPAPCCIYSAHNLPKSMMKSAATFGIIGIFALVNPSLASTNLVTNGGFEVSSPVNAAAFPTSAGGIGQVSEIVISPGWAKATIKNPESGGFAFVVNASADNDNGSPYPNQGGGFPFISSPPSQSNLFLWGPDYSSFPVPNGFSASPSGGNFWPSPGIMDKAKYRKRFLVV